MLFKLKSKENRKAQFRTVISLMWNGNEIRFEGICKGIIIANKRGENGFGYDSVFIPDGSKQTFAEMDLEQKSNYSHRRKAADQFKKYLLENF